MSFKGVLDNTTPTITVGTSSGQLFHNKGNQIRQGSMWRFKNKGNIVFP